MVRAKTITQSKKSNQGVLKKMIDFDLLKAVVKQIQEDADDGDYTAIEDLLKDIPKKRLVGFLELGIFKEDGD